MSVRVEPSSTEEDLYCKPARSAVVTDLHVLPEFRGKGIGKWLLGKAEECATTRHIPYVKLQVFAGNTRARVFYQALGYQEVAVTLVKQITNELP
jgi:ribosomal protein S18 acetylase RimI-like enzyme